MQIKQYSWKLLFAGIGLLALGFGFLLLLPLGIAMVISAGFCLIFTKTVEKHCTLYSTATALGLSAVGGAGLCCTVNAFRIARSNNVRKFPVGYPASIAGGIACLVIFLAFIVVYFFTRKGKFTVIGLALDILTGILYLPGFFMLSALLAAIVSLFV